jgi:hypothetical protein
MIPEFNDDGYLPPGVHAATLDEIEDRFGKETELRRVQMESLRWLVDLSRRAGVERLIVNGSFVTDALEPNDVDCVLLLRIDFPLDRSPGQELADGLPFLEIQFVQQARFSMLVERFFATDRRMKPKGMVEVIL